MKYLLVLISSYVCLNVRFKEGLPYYNVYLSKSFIGNMNQLGMNVLPKNGLDIEAINSIAEL